MKVADNDLLQALLLSPSAAEAAKALGISRQSVCKRLKNPILREKFSNLRRQALESSATVLSQNSTAAAERLAELLRSPNEQIALAAATRIIKLSAVSLEQLDILERLDNLEMLTENDDERG